MGEWWGRAVGLRIFALLLLFGSFAGCSGAVSPGGEPPPPDPDPWEPMNRKIFWFNEQVDHYVLEPAAIGWDWVLPDPVERSISHFFDNVRFPIVAGNDLLQGKPRAAATETGRFLVNTTVGVAGFFDPATSLGLERHPEDFGQTLGWWGAPPGPYLVLPLLGPTNVRDTAGLLGDYPLSVAPFFVNQYILLGARVADTVNTRARFLEEVRDARDAALDFYVFSRHAYTKSRAAKVNDATQMTTEQQDDLYYFENGSEQEE
ncbi:MAG: MlaA family lipoprotein [Candidatus Binatia bacterium]